MVHKIKLSISNIFFLNMLIIAVCSTVIIGYVWIYHEQQDYSKDVLELEQEYISTQKQNLEYAVRNAVNYIEYKRGLTQDILKENIKLRTYEAFNITENIYKNNIGKRPDNEIIDLIKQSLRTVRFFDNRNYYFIDDLEGNSILFPPKPTIEGENLLGIVNKEGVRPFPEIIKLVKDKGEGYYIYNWVKYTEKLIPTDKEFPKITYFKLFEPYNWFIAVGEYLDYVEQDIMQEILGRIAKISFNNEEYVDIHTYDGVKLVSHGEVLLTQVYESGMAGNNGKELFQEIKNTALSNNEGFIFHDTIYNKNDDTGRMISFVVNLSDWKWIISASTSLDEVNKVIAHKKVKLNRDVKNNISHIIIIIFGLILFALILSKYVSFKFKTSFYTFEKFFNKASTEAVNIDINSLGFREFAELAQMANQMIESRQTAEAMLKESESRFQQLAANLKEILWLTSPTWDEILYISPAYEETWGRSCASLYKDPRSWMYSIHEDDVQSVSDYLQKISKGGLSEIIFPEYRIRKKDGSIHWILARGFPVLNKEGEVYRIVGISEDITERKQSECAIHTLVVSTAGITGQHFFDNVVKHLCNWLNCEVSLIGKIHKESAVKVISMIVDGDLSNEFCYNLAGTPCEKAHKDGFCYYPDNIVSQFPDDKDLVLLGAEGYIGTQIINRQGQIIGILNVISRNKLDLPKGAKEVLNIIAARISAEIERRDAEFEKSILEEKLRQSQKMEAIGTLAGGIAHDFNNILAAILGYAEMAKDDAPQESSIIDDLEKVIQAGHRAKDLVQQILTFSRQGDSECISFQPASIIKEALKMIRPSLPRTIEITQNIDPAAGPIFADPTQINQVLMNLCTNAFHAMEKTGGRMDITLTETNISSDVFAHEPNIKDGNYIQLSVGDSGTGISPEIKDRIFDPYFTTKETGKGTGMGLAIVHGIVKSFGGFISIDSELGKGTVFHVFLPVTEKERLPENKISELIPLGKEKILFIDDEEILAEMGKDMLIRLGYQVTVRNNSLEALETFQNQPDQFDLIITDQTMPGMTGVDLARRMMRIRPDIPIILCTGYSSIISEEKAKSIGIREFAMKPMAKKDIAKLIRKALDG